MEQKTPLQQLTDTLKVIERQWASCKEDPANLNHLYTITGTIIMALIDISDHLQEINK